MTDAVNKPKISPDERVRREEAFKAASASSALEGVPPSPALVAAARRYIDGDIEFDDLLKAFI